MESGNHLQAAGVKEYGSPQDVPYLHDYSYSHFKGSYGVIYRATRSPTRLSRSHDSVYAIKEIQAVSLIDQKKVVQEINFLRQLQHPNILDFEEAYTIKTSAQRPVPTIHLVTRPWAPVSLQHFIEDVCLSALNYLHAQEPRPIRHKDIKPHNILLYFDPHKPNDAQIRPIITDFGISKEHIDHATTANTGTYEYKAPEQIRDEKPTLKSDVFSLGCCFASIEGIIAPWPGLVDVYDAAMATESCQFANNVHLVDSALTNIAEQQSSSSGTNKSLFCMRFRSVVRRMLEQKPKDRISASMALNIVEGIESDIALEREFSASAITATELDLLKLILDLERLKEVVRQQYLSTSDPTGTQHRGFMIEGRPSLSRVFDVIVTSILAIVHLVSLIRAINDSILVWILLVLEAFLIIMVLKYNDYTR